MTARRRRGCAPSQPVWPCWRRPWRARERTRPPIRRRSSPPSESSSDRRPDADARAHRDPGAGTRAADDRGGRRRPLRGRAAGPARRPRVPRWPRRRRRWPPPTSPSSTSRRPSAAVVVPIPPSGTRSRRRRLRSPPSPPPASTWRPWPTTTPSTSAADPLPGTFDAIDAALAADPPLAVVGIGRDVDDAFRPARVDVDGTIVATIGATVADQDPTADPTGQWAATADSPGTADAIDPARLLRAVARGRPVGRRGRRLHALGHPGRAVPERRAAVPGGGPGRRRAPTSSSAVTPTGSRATAGWATATWRTGSGTTPGTPSRRRRRP